MRWSERDLGRYLTRRGLVPRKRETRQRPTLPQGRLPQAQLQAMVQAAYPGRFTPERTGLIPGRRYRADLCDVTGRAIIECDGWRHHGMYKAAFHRDRERDFEFTVHGWRILRIPAGLILTDPHAVLERVQRFVDMLDAPWNRAEANDVS